jgi:lipoprotein-anchoring transpeptidase ErfK/SrfK
MTQDGSGAHGAAIQIITAHGSPSRPAFAGIARMSCFRLVNEQIEDLFERVPVGTKVIVQQ